MGRDENVVVFKDTKRLCKTNERLQNSIRKATESQKLILQSDDVQAQEKIEAMYRDREGWARSALANTACSGKFSSDRTIEDYARDIWKIEKLKQPVSCHRD